MKRAFQVHRSDNVATSLDDAAIEAVQVIRDSETFVIALPAAIQIGHKLAVTSIRAGEPVVKYAVPIGIATRAIAIGEWVHLHNCRSQVDERSSTFDPQTGATTDVAYE